MVHLLKDIEILESALIGINEGASDEKYAALYSLEKLLLEKKDMVAEFEAEYAPKEQGCSSINTPNPTVRVHLLLTLP